MKAVDYKLFSPKKLKNLREKLEFWKMILLLDGWVD